MPTPSKGYRNAKGEKIPGTTTIIGRWKESGALIAWAYNRGKDGLELYESRDKAAELGTIVHSMVEAFCTGHIKETDFTDTLLTKDVASVLSAYEAFKEWFEMNKFEIVEQEIQLVSEVHQFGGTPDAIAKDSKGRLVLLDWKTSNGVYQDHLIQLAAYRLLWNENFPDNPLTGGSHLCRFAKENGDFAHHFFPDLSEEEQQFIDFRRCYERDKRIKKRAA